MRVLLSSLCLCLTLATAAAAQQTPVRLTQLHDALHLDGQQEEAWRSYTAAIAPSDQAQARRHATEQMLPKLTTPRRIALLDATMEQDLTDRRRQGDAVIAFYGRLTPAQQAVFDRQTLQSPTGASGN